MGKRITCREIIIFIAKFKIWTAEFGSNLNGLTFVIVDDDRATKEIYILCEDGDYVVRVLDEKLEDYIEVESGNMFDWEEIK